MGGNVRDTGQVHMAYFYFDFRDTASQTLAYNIETIRSGQNPEKRGRWGDTPLPE